ncbi:MAG: type II toxin-antitoxin system RelE/ParE family toxin [Xanthobacteraceae bacterium]
MAIKLVWSNQAREDLLDIYVLIGVEDPAAAERYFDRIDAKIEILQSQPRIGVRRPDIRAGMRMLVEAPYVILYRIEPDTDDGPVTAVEIIRIIDGRRDLAHLF